MKKRDTRDYGSIRYTARKHDAEVIRHLLQRPCGGVIGDPGTGKTGQVLATHTTLLKKNLIDKLLIFAPLNPIHETWPAEIEKWGFPLTHAILHGSKKDEALRTDADVYLINYDGLEWLSANHRELLKRGKRWWAVFDESTKIKHTNTKRFKLLRPMLPRFGRRTALTGTPAPNGLMDLFGQVYAIDLGERLGRYVTAYRREYFYPSGYGGYTWVLQEDGEKRIYEKLDGLFYRVDERVLDLPKLHDVPLWVPLTPKAKKVYDTLEKEFVAEVRKNLVTAVNAGVLSQKLRQVACGQLYDENHDSIEVHDRKIEAVTDLVEQLQGNPLLIGYEFTANGEKLAEVLDAPLINGDTKRKEVKAIIADFNKGKHRAVVTQFATVALGLNMQEACHTMALFGLPWNLETYIQWKKRVHRGGQKRQVIAHHILARGTIEELQWRVLGEKGRTQAKLLTAIQRRYL